MRILIVSDIHANLAALEAVIQDAGPVERVWCLGDIVGYGPNPNECIERLRQFTLLCTAGNHDLGVAGKAGLWDFGKEAREAIFWTRHVLSPENMDWLSALPDTVVFTSNRIALVHASPRDPVWEYITERELARRCFDILEADICLHGHTHIPLVFRQLFGSMKVIEERLTRNTPISLYGDRLLINPGSVGQPRDEDARAAYAVVDTQAMTLTHKRVAYDIAATQRLMKQARLPDRLIRRLRFGQ